MLTAAGTALSSPLLRPEPGSRLTSRCFSRTLTLLLLKRLVLLDKFGWFVRRENLACKWFFTADLVDCKYGLELE
jgi:hypothetical protein